MNPRISCSSLSGVRGAESYPRSRGPHRGRARPVRLAEHTSGAIPRIEAALRRVCCPLGGDGTLLSMYVTQNIYNVALESPHAPALIYNLEPFAYSALHRMITAMRARLRSEGLRPGGVVVVRIDNIMAAWIVDLASRDLGLTTVAIRADQDFASLTGLDVVAIVSFAEEPRPALDPAVLPGVPRLSVSQADWRFDAATTELE